MNANVNAGAEALAQALVENLHRVQAKLPRHATPNDWYMALAHTIRDRLMDRYIAHLETLTTTESVKVVAYLSAEFLTGPHLGNSLLSLGLWDEAEQAVSKVGQELTTLLEQEEEPGLGNGGLGRLAACYMDSLATLNVPAIGYGIRYEFGIFDQAIRDGWQIELTDKWLRYGNPWEIVRSETTFDVKFGGRTERYSDEHGHERVRWLPARAVKGVAYDTPVPGYRAPTVDILRLWKAEAAESFDFEAFNVGDYYRAVDDKVESETITKVLYPNDEPVAGKKLRLLQQFFFVSCSLQDMLRLHLMRGKRVDEFDRGWAVQLNDTHPSIAVAELMRLLIDEHLLPWEDAWGVTVRTCGYTNHTLLAEALEKWPLPLFGAILPRHLEIIYEINRRFLDDVRSRFPGDDLLLRRLSLIDETGERHVRMAHLAAVGSHAINGVAALHSALLKQTVLRDFHTVAPEKFFNVTNGVTPRRWLALSNPRLSALITRHIGDRWPADLERELARIEPLAADAGFRQDWRAVKADNKRQTGRPAPGPHRCRRRSGVAVRHPGEAAPRVQAAAPERSLPGHPLQPADACVRRVRHAAHRDLRRQGRARLPDGQADHPPDQRRRRRHQPRPEDSRPVARRLPARLQREDQPARLPGGGPLRTDLHRGQGSVGHRQHEVLDERRADHRYARRRERRDSRRGRRRRTSSCSA